MEQGLKPICYWAGDRWAQVSLSLRAQRFTAARLQSLVSIQDSAGWSSVSNTSLNLGTDAVDGSNSGVALRQFGQLQLQGCDDGTAGTWRPQQPRNGAAATWNRITASAPRLAQLVSFWSYIKAMMLRAGHHQELFLLQIFEVLAGLRVFKTTVIQRERLHWTRLVSFWKSCSLQLLFVPVWV